MYIDETESPENIALKLKIPPLFNARKLGEKNLGEKSLLLVRIVDLRHTDGTPSALAGCFICGFFNKKTNRCNAEKNIIKSREEFSSLLSKQEIDKMEKFFAEIKEAAGREKEYIGSMFPCVNWCRADDGRTMDAKYESLTFITIVPAPLTEQLDLF